MSHEEPTVVPSRLNSASLSVPEDLLAVGCQHPSSFGWKRLRFPVAHFDLHSYSLMSRSAVLWTRMVSLCIQIQTN